MHGTQLLHNLLQESSAINHIKRQETLVASVESILNGAKLTDLSRLSPNSPVILK